MLLMLTAALKVSTSLIHTQAETYTLSVRPKDRMQK